MPTYNKGPCECCGGVGCCPGTDLPTTLYASNLAAIDCCGGGSIELTGGAGFWSGSGEWCHGHTITVSIRCNLDTSGAYTEPHWEGRLQISCGYDSGWTPSQAEGTCEPFEQHFLASEIDCIECCGGELCGGVAGVTSIDTYVITA